MLAMIPRRPPDRSPLAYGAAFRRRAAARISGFAPFTAGQDGPSPRAGLGKQEKPGTARRSCMRGPGRWPARRAISRVYAPEFALFFSFFRRGAESGSGFVAHGSNLVVGPFLPGPVLLFCPYWFVDESPPRSRSHGLPDPRLDGPGGLPPEALRPPPPRGVRLPAVWRPRGPQRPPPSPRLPGRRLPLQGMSPGVQYVHGDILARDSPQPRADPLDPPRHRPGGPHREARPRGGDQSPTPAAAAA
jgi:hypothetical protein